MLARLFNGYTTAFLKLLLAFALGVGTAVAAAYNTFETAAHHAGDQARTEQMLQEIRGDVKILLRRLPQQSPTDEGYSNPPLPRKQAGG